MQRQQKGRPGGSGLASCLVVLVVLVAIVVTGLLAVAIVQLGG